MLIPTRLATVLAALVATGCASRPAPAEATPTTSAVTLVQVPAAPPVPSAGGTEDRPDPRAAYIRSHYTKFEYRVPVRDGVRLFTAVYLPNDASEGTRYPILMQRTPYEVSPYGADRYATRIGPSEAAEKEGFIFVLQDVRGKHMSEGEFVDVRPETAGPHAPGSVDESTDAYDTIEWLLAHVRHHNGNVGQWGISYDGYYTSTSAINSHPALKAVSPQAPVGDWFVGDDFHRNGAFNLQEAFTYFDLFGRPRAKPVDTESTWKLYEFGTPDAYQFYLDLGPLSEVDAKHFKGEVAFWKDCVAHPDYDEFWKARNVLPRLQNVKAAVLVVGGWYDTEDLYGTLGTYRAIEEQNPGIVNTLIMGPWRHGGWNFTPGDRLGDAHFGWPTSEGYQARELAFFKHHLKGGEDPKLPEALVFETGANRWRQFDRWPPTGTQDLRLFFHPGGGLSAAAPTAERAHDEYVSDPAKPVPYTEDLGQRWSADYMAQDQRFASRRPDVLVYVTPPLEYDVTVAGPVDVDLFVSTTGTDADWVVKLIDVNPGKMPGWTDEDAKKGKRDRGGQQTLVRGEPFRGRFRDGLDAPKPFVPGEVARIRYALDDVFHTFLRGHRIMVHVQSSWFPFVDRNPQTFVPNIFNAKAADFVAATQRVHRSKSAASSVTLHVLPAADQ